MYGAPTCAVIRRREQVGLKRGAAVDTWASNARASQVFFLKVFLDFFFGLGFVREPRSSDRPAAFDRSGGSGSENGAFAISALSALYFASDRTLRNEAIPSFHACNICLATVRQRVSLRAAAITSRPISTADSHTRSTISA